MELVGVPLAVAHPDGVKPDAFKIGESGALGDPRIEAQRAEQLIAAITGAVMDGVPRRRLAATLFASLVCHVVLAVRFRPAIAAALGSGCHLFRHCSSQVRQHAARQSRKGVRRNWRTDAAILTPISRPKSTHKSLPITEFLHDGHFHREEIR
nr:hypothetical protein [Paraburkholderia sacchari]